MSRDRVRGLAEANALFNNLPAAAAHELADTIGRISRDVQSAQQAAVPRRTGALRGALLVQLLTERLRARVGLLAQTTGGYKFNGRARKLDYGGYFYGRFVEFGRKAQTVLVTRRLKRRIKGNGRNGTKRRAIYEGKPYKLRVKAMAPRTFVNLPATQALAAQRIADFWSRTLPAAGASA